MENCAWHMVSSAEMPAADIIINTEPQNQASWLGSWVFSVLTAPRHLPQHTLLTWKSLQLAQAQGFWLLIGSSNTVPLEGGSAWPAQPSCSLWYPGRPGAPCSGWEGASNWGEEQWLQGCRQPCWGSEGTGVASQALRDSVSLCTILPAVAGLGMAAPGEDA